MKFGSFLYQNAKWQTKRNCFAHLVALPTTEQQLLGQLQKLSEKYFYQRKTLKLLNTEFCLNKIALTKPKDSFGKVVMQHFDEFWQRFVQLKKILQKDYLTFPSNDVTRVEQIASLIAKCTQFCLSKEQLNYLLDRCANLFDLTEREKDYLPHVIELYKINYFCAVAQGGNKDQICALFSDESCQNLPQNHHYKQAIFQGENLVCVCDNLGNSTTSFLGKTITLGHKCFVYKNNRNLFDTFCTSKFFANCAHFESITNNVRVGQKYFLKDCFEVRKITLQNLGKKQAKHLFESTIQAANLTTSANVLCGKHLDVCFALAIVCDNQIAPSKTCQNALLWEVTLLPNQQRTFDLVTVFAPNEQELAIKLQSLNNFGATAFCQLPGEEQNCTNGQKLHLTPCSNAIRNGTPVQSTKLNFTYQLGNCDVATFVDNGGRCATLLDGFAFGTGGEKIYAIRCGNFRQLNVGNFSIDGKLTFDKQTSRCTIFHDDKKHVEICHKTGQKTLILLPFERQSKVIFDKNTFVITDGKRHYYVKCNGVVESFSTDNFECNSQKLRHKLSNDLNVGNCLCICFASALKVSVEIGNATQTPNATPLIQESLVSTYLNYVNGKEVFCLKNHFKRPTALSLAAICYTNPQFVKGYLKRIWQNKQDLCYYDGAGNRQKQVDELLFDLGCIYYATLVKDETFPTDKMRAYVNAHLLTHNFEGKQLVVWALALKKASQLEGFDKVKCLVEYAKIKKIICNDSSLLQFAQAIGALPLTNPSKERLKDLCNKFDVAKNWYYVSQLENLYGLNLHANSLAITPKVTNQNVLEQFALNFGGKRIATSFAKGTAQTMTLNGMQCCQPFDPYALKNNENTLVVSY